MFKKIFFVIIVLLLTSTCVSANDFKVSDGFEYQFEGHYCNGDFYLNILNYTDELYELYTTNDSEREYNVNPHANNTYLFASTGEEGALEVIHFENKTYIVVCWSPLGNHQHRCYDYLMEFNKINNIQTGE